MSQIKENINDILDEMNENLKGKKYNLQEQDLQDIEEISSKLGVDKKYITKHKKYKNNIDYFIINYENKNVLEIKINQAVCLENNIRESNFIFKKCRIISDGTFEILQPMVTSLVFTSNNKAYCEFYNCKIEVDIMNKNYESLFKECEFYTKTNIFINAKYEKCLFKEKIHYENNEFLGKINLKECIFKEEIFFNNIVFKNSVNFSKSTFEKNASFKNCAFNKLSGDDFFDFSEITFKENVYFDDSYFNEFVDFHLCVFEKTASFYRTKFNVIPNFSPGDFKGILNINNATWGQEGNLEFEDVKNITEKAYGKSDKEEKKLEKIRNIKDSFRTIKNVLIQKNDQLEAQKFHKAELYCKELELEKELKIENKNNKNFAIYIDSLLLKFYRNTSDHHTNFLKILNFTLLVIVAYFITSLIFNNIYLEWFIFDKLSVISIFAVLLFFILFIGLYGRAFARLGFIWLPREPKNITVKFETIIILSTIVLTMIFGLLFDKIEIILTPIMIYLYLLMIYIMVKRCRLLRDGSEIIKMTLLYFSVTLVLIFSPQLINPFVGVFKSDEILSKNYFEKKLNDLNASEIMEISALLQNNTYLSFKNTNAEIINAKELIKQKISTDLKDINIANNELNATIANLKEVKDLQEHLENVIKSSSLVYSIILLLCLYSLTKTARKNSIVPI